MRKLYMPEALKEAMIAKEKGEVPVGAVVVSPDGDIISKAHNQCEALKDPTAHAEFLALREASKILGLKRLVDYSLYVTLEPCPMCTQAISFFRVRTLYYGAPDPKGGAVDHGPYLFDQPTCFHRPDVYGGIMEDSSRKLLKEFFAKRRISSNRGVTL